MSGANGHVAAGQRRVVGDAVVPLSEVQERLGLSRSRLYARLQSVPPSLPARRIGGKWLIYRSEWDIFLQEGLGPSLAASGQSSGATRPNLDPDALAKRLLRELEGRTVTVELGDVRFNLTLQPAAPAKGGPV